MQMLKKSLSILVVCALLFACMPAVTLPAKAAETVQTKLLDFDSLTVGANVGTMQGTTANKYGPATATISANGGIDGSRGLLYTVQSADYNQNQNVQLDDELSTHTVQAETDILWFWIDSDLSNDRLLHIQVNGTSLYKEQAIYTIVNNNGTPEIGSVGYVDDCTTIETMAPVNATWGGGNSYARVKMPTGWYGWIGVPMSSFGISSGSISKIQLRIYGNVSVAPITVGETVNIDEFWLTSANTMPDLTQEKLLYNGDPAEVEPEIRQELLWNIEGSSVNIDSTYKDDTRNHSYLKNSDGTGIGGSASLQYGIASNPGHDMTNTINFDPVSLGLDGTIQINALDDIIWYWVDLDYEEDQFLQFSVNGITLANNASGMVYTIQADSDGEPTIVEIPYGGSDAVAGVDLLQHSAGSNVSILKLYDGFNGWIGMPVSMISSGTSALAVGATVIKFGIVVRQKTSGDLNNQSVSDCIYLDEFWITSADTMPDLTSAELLWDGDPVPVEEVTLANRYQDNMIFQRDEAWMLHGTAVAGETVTVKLLDSEGNADQTKTATAGSDGLWGVAMDAVAGSYDAYTVEVICGSTTQTLSNVVFGEVWVTGGQSNMFYTIAQTNNEMFAANEDVAALQTYLTDNPTAAGAIRMYYADETPTTAETEQTEVVGTWKTAATWESVEGTSAVAMYYAKLLQAELNMPVGVVVAARGGTSIATWVDADVAANYSEFTTLVQSLKYHTTTSAQYKLSGYYNAHVAPWQGYNVAGMLWYQGEQDRFHPEMQTLGFEVLAESWSKVFTTDPTSGELLDMIAIQIAPFVGYTDSETGAFADPELTDNFHLNAAMREGAAKVQAKGGNVVLVPIYDLSAIVDDHHPLNKLDVANRIIQVAKETYYDAVSGNESYSGPKPVSVQVEEGSVLVTFDQNIQYIQLNTTDNERITTDDSAYVLPEDSELYGDKLNGFGLWTGLTYISAEAEIVGDDQVRITVPEGVTAAGVTYAYGLEVLSANLYDADGLPALPFRYVTGENVEHTTRLWSADEVEAVVIKEENASSGRNTSKISIADGVGFGGSQGLKYELVTAGNQRTHTWSSSAIATYGFRTDITVANDDDILWFWVDADFSTVQRLQIAVNGQNIIYGSDSYIYTLRSGADGEPVIVKLPAGGADGVDCISLMPHGNSSQGQLQLEPDWYGWVGVPVNMIANEAVTAGGTIGTLSVLLVQSDNTDYASQQEGDAVILDEFWLTSAGQYPAMDDLIDYQICIVDFEHSSMSDGMALENVPETNAGRDTVSAQIAGDIGVGESNALEYTLQTAVKTNSGNITLSAGKLGAEVFTEVQILDSSNILWFWVDSDLPVERLLHVQVNGKLPAVSTGIYTIGTDDDGKPAILEIAPNAAVNGLQLVDSVGGEITADSNTYARLRMDANWCGWVGIPVGNFTRSGSSEVDAPSGSLTSAILRLYGPVNEILEGEAVFFDEFWLTEAGKMPALSASKLPYSTEHQTGIWALDESDTALTDPFVVDNAERNQAVISRVTEQGVLGSNSLQYTLTELVSDTGDNRLDLTETLKLIDDDTTDTDELSDNGFITGVKVTAETDILWFWIDSDVSRNMRIQPGVNNLGIRGGFEESNPTELSVNKNIWVYTIEDVNGVPTMKRLYQESCAAVVNGVGLVNSSRGDHGEYAQLKFTDGWSGWIGIPLNMFYDSTDPTAKISVGDTIREITLQMRIYNGVDGSMYKQVANESMYIDEFWLTTVWMMPDLDVDALLYKDTEIPMEDGHLLSPEKADCYIDLINSDAGSLMDKSYFTYTPSADQPKSYYDFGIAKGEGYLGGNAFYIGFAGENPGDYTNWANLDVSSSAAISELNIGNGSGTSSAGMLWMWIDGTDLTADARLTVHINSMECKYLPSYYTIAAGTNGYYLVENTLVYYETNKDLVYAGGEAASIPITKGFQGWIGIPLECYTNDATTVLDITQLNFHLKRTATGSQHTTGSTIYISDLYIADTYTAGGETTWEIPPMAELKFSSASLVLENGISVKFKAKPGLFVDESVEDTVFYHTPYAIFTLHDVVNVIPGVYNEETGMYEFTYYNIRPDWMGDDINAYLYAYRDGTLYRSEEVKLYSVEDYCYNTLSRYYGSAAADGNDALGDLLVDVLKYGAAVQQYTGHNTDALVTANLTGTAWEGWGNKDELSLESHQSIAADLDNATAQWKGAALFLRETTRIRLRFATELTDEVTVAVQCGDQSWTISSEELSYSGNNYYFYFDGLNATQMRQPVTFQVMCGDTPVSKTLTYSVETYAYNAVKSGGSLAAAMEALIRYGDSAIAYVSSLN